MTEIKSKFVLEHEGEINKVTEKIIETKMKVEESEIGTKIKKGATEFVAEHEEEINKVKATVEETKMKLEKKVKQHAKKESRDSSNDGEVVSVDEIEPEKDDKSKANRDDPETPTDSIENETPLETNNERNSTTEKDENPPEENISVETVKDTEGDETEASSTEDDDDSTNNGKKRSEKDDITNSSTNDTETTQVEDGSNKCTVKISKLKKTIKDVRLKIEKTIKEVSDKEEVKKIVVPLKMKLVIAKAKLIELKEGKSSNDNETTANTKTNTKLPSEHVAANFVATAGIATKKVVTNARMTLQKAASKVGIIDDDDFDNDEKKTKDDDSTPTTSEDEIDGSDNMNNKNEDDTTKTKTKLPIEQVAVNFVTTAGDATKKVVTNTRMTLQKAASKAGLIDDADGKSEKEVTATETATEKAKAKVEHDAKAAE